jgi:hypothetical protein
LTDGDILRQLLLSNFIPSPTPVIRRSVFEEVGYFNESPDMRIGEDWDMWLRIAAKYPVGFVDLPLALIRRHAASMTTSMNLQLSLRGKLAIIEQAVKRNGLRLIDLEKKAMANVYNATAEAMLARGVDRHTTRALFRKSLALNPARLGPVFGLMLSMVPRHVFACLYAIRRRVAQRRRTDVAGWNK